MIRVYGFRVGEGSFVQVTRGMERALALQGRLSGSFPVDAKPLEDECIDGADAPVALCCGAPVGSVEAAHFFGAHLSVWLILAPNSNKLPQGLIEFFASQELRDRLGTAVVDGLIAPSAWAADVLKSTTGLPVVLVPHGVNPEIHVTDPRARETLLQVYRGGGFRVLHMTSTLAERKSTELLVEAWSALGWTRSELCIVVNPPEYGDACELVEEHGATETVRVVPGFSMSQHQAAHGVRSAHVLCQPSRGEGFGMLPLEARAMGVPVVMTACTGHSEHWSDSEGLGDPPGVITVESGLEAPIDDLPGAMAPSVEVAAIMDALQEARDTYERLADQAMGSADRVRERWAWERVTKHGIDAVISRSV